MDNGGEGSRSFRSRTPYRCCRALDQQPWRFEKAAPRWHARLYHGAHLTVPVAQLALAALHALAGPGAVGASQALVAVCTARDLDDVVGVLAAWLDAPRSGPRLRSLEVPGGTTATVFAVVESLGDHAGT